MSEIPSKPRTEVAVVGMPMFVFLMICLPFGSWKILEVLTWALSHIEITIK